MWWCNADVQQRCAPSLYQLGRARARAVRPPRLQGERRGEEGRDGRCHSPAGAGECPDPGTPPPGRSAGDTVVGWTSTSEGSGASGLLPRSRRSAPTSPPWPCRCWWWTTWAARPRTSVSSTRRAGRPTCSPAPQKHGWTPTWTNTPRRDRRVVRARFPSPAAPAPTTTSSATAAPPTTPPCGSSRTASSASCTAASKPAPPITRPPPGTTTPHPSPLDHQRHGMSANRSPGPPEHVVLKGPHKGPNVSEAARGRRVGRAGGLAGGDRAQRGWDHPGGCARRHRVRSRCGAPTLDGVGRPGERSVGGREGRGAGGVDSCGGRGTNPTYPYLMCPRHHLARCPWVARLGGRWRRGPIGSSAAALGRLSPRPVRGRSSARRRPGPRRGVHRGRRR